VAAEPVFVPATAATGHLPDYAGLPESTCLHATYPAARRHRIATLLVPYRRSEPRRIFNFMDDQGYDADLYFTDPDENTFKITLKKLAKS